MTEIIEKLKQSPLYNLSLTNLENFHTAFWKWVGDNYPLDFVKIFDNTDINKAEYRREVKHRRYKEANWCNIRVDLEIKTDVGYIYLENKLKSFPNNKQLREYDYVLSPKSDNPQFILLSLVPESKLPEHWQYMSYQNLCEKFKKIFNSKFEYKHDYHKYLIEDYINMIEKISDIFMQACNQDQLKYNFYNKELDNIGLNDIYTKFKASQLLSYIMEQLPEDIRENTEGHSGLNNKKGTVGITFFINDYHIGIQIEGMQYRYFTITNSDKDKLKKVSEELLAEKLWFVDTLDVGSTAKHKPFCSYTTDNYAMFYRYRKMDELFGEEITFDKIAKQVIKDLCMDMESLDKMHDRAKNIGTTS
jgi:hypothetical protein